MKDKIIQIVKDKAQASENLNDEIRGQAVYDYDFDSIAETIIQLFKNTEAYIITFEDGSHSLATKITADDENAVCDGILSIIRCSDAMELLPTGEWQKLPNWGA